MARLGHRRVQPQHAVRPVHRRAARGRPAARARRSISASRRASIAITAPRGRRNHPRGVPGRVCRRSRADHRDRLARAHRGCARCHDHKYDPISQKDFYRLFAYFNQIPNERGFVWNYGPEEPFVKAPLPEQQKRLAELDRGWRLDRASGTRCSRNCGGAGALGIGTARHAPIGRRPRPRLPRRGARATFNGDAAEFSYLQPFTYSAWINPAAAERRDSHAARRLHGEPGPRAVPDRRHASGCT